MAHDKPGPTVAAGEVITREKRVRALPPGHTDWPARELGIGNISSGTLIEFESQSRFGQPVSRESVAMLHGNWETHVRAEATGVRGGGHGRAGATLPGTSKAAKPPPVYSRALLEEGSRHLGGARRLSHRACHEAFWANQT
jgi:hypothetical protein